MDDETAETRKELMEAVARFSTQVGTFCLETHLHLFSVPLWVRSLNTSFYFSNRMFLLF